MQRFVLVAVALAALVSPLRAADEPVDLGMITRIRDEAIARSQVMDTLFQLTDVIGPRLTGSPQLTKASAWTRDQLVTWGIGNAHLESWGPFGVGWSVEHVSVHLLRPDIAPLIALPRAWTPGTNGVLRAPVVKIKAESEADFAKYQGTLAGKIVLVGDAREPADGSKPLTTRLTSQELEELKPIELSPEASELDRYAALIRTRLALDAFLGAEGAVAMIDSSQRVAAVGVQQGGRSDTGKGARVPALSMQMEHFNRLARLVDKGVEVELEIDIRVRTHDDPVLSNTLAEIPGSDPSGEVVMLGAHLDSWQGGTGATDNAAGSAVAMEALRILKATGARPKRTIRLALWTGEEQGVLGSRAYVDAHFGSRALSTDPKQADLPIGMRTYAGPVTLKPEHARLSAYFNLDDGAGRIRGIFAQGNAAAVPILSAWLRPFEDMGVTTVSQRLEGQTDTESFEDVGLPGFAFIQDPLDYRSRTHHTNMDLYDRAHRDDLVQASIVMASVVWQAANRPGPFPRKPLPR